MHRVSLTSVNFPILLIGAIILLNTLSTECRKELPSHAVFPEQVLEAIGCDVCRYALTNLANQVQAAREEKESKSLKLNEEDVLEIIEEVCIPFTAKGEWVRLVALEIPCTPSIKNGTSSDIESESCTKLLDFHTYCKRTCRSVEEVCERLMGSEEMDRLSDILLKNANKSVKISDPEVINKMIREVCNPVVFCLDRSKYQRRLERDLNTTTIHGTLLEQILSDKTEEIDGTSMELERMMYSARDNPEQQPVVFSEEDMEKMAKGYRIRNQAMAAEVDPEIADLNKEEFDELHHVANEEHLNL